MILCEHPRFIVNPSLPELVAKFHKYSIDGHIYHDNRKYRLLYSFDVRPFQQRLDHINNDNVDDFFVFDEKTGETYPIFLQVPCGHCTLCRERKASTMVHRMKYESYCYHCKPIFATLTYAPNCLPSDGLSVRDTQLFLKRFRINLSRNGFPRPIRYAIVGEYGKPRYTSRPHYHCIFFGCYADDDYSFRQFQKQLEKSWPLGNVKSRHINPADDKGFAYTLKYMRKACDVPADKRPLFFHASNRGGGLGSRFLLRQRSEMRVPQCRYDVLNPFSNRLEPFKWSTYALDKIYPSVNKSLPLNLRKALKKYVLAYSLWKINDPDTLWLWESNYHRIRNTFRSLLYLPFDGLGIADIPLQSMDSNIQISLPTYESVILKYIDKDFSNVLQLNENRKYLLANMQFDEITDSTLLQRVIHIKRTNSHLKNFEVL